jgi:competence protein ComEC
VTATTGHGPAEEGDWSTPSVGRVLGPLPLWAAAAVAGGLLGEGIAGPAGPLVAAVLDRRVARSGALLVVVVVAGLGGWAAARRDGATSRTAVVTGRSVLPGLVALVAIAVATAGGAALRIASAELGLLPRLAAEGGRAELGGTVVHEPRPIASGWHVLLRIDAVDGLPTRERAATTLDGDPPALGTAWTLRASARPLPEGGYGAWLRRQHASVVLDVVAWEPRAPAGRLARASEHVRARVRDVATRHLDDRTGGLLVGFVTGDTRLLPAADREAMQVTGLSHLTAVSGSNVAIVVGGVLGLLAVARVGTRVRWVAVGLVVPWFAFVTRFEPSVQRAGTMTLLLLATSVRGVPRDPRHALAGAVLLLVLVDPLLAGSLGLLLSATATAGVLVAAPRVRAHLPSWLPRRAAELAAITIGAQLAVVPVLLASFGELTFASVPANLLAVPAAALAAVLAFVGSTVGLLHAPAGGVVMALAGPPAWLVLGVAGTLQRFEGRADLMRPLTVAALLAGCGWLLATPRTRLARRALVTSLVLVGAVLVPPLTGGSLPPVLTVTAIDVGQGDAFLLEAPGARVLVDAGEDGTAARWLREHGRRSLDLLVVSHGHLDHVGGAPPVLRRLDVGTVWYRPIPTELPEVAELLAVAAERDVPVRDVAAGDRVTIGTLTLEVLGPPPGRPYRYERSELNETSLVLRATAGGRRVLLAGDAERAAQADLLGTPTKLDVDLLAVPHHGAATTDPAFLRAARAAVAVISVGADNRHGHPHPDVLEVLEELGTEVRRTDLEGTLRIEVPLGAQTAADGPPDPRSVGSPHDPVPAPRGRRRPAAAARAGAAARPAAGRGPGAGGRGPRRHGDRAPARAADPVAVRWPDLRGPPRGGDARRRPQGRGGGVRLLTLRRRGARPRRSRCRQDPEARQAGQGS